MSKKISGACLFYVIILENVMLPIFTVKENQILEQYQQMG